MYLLWINNEKCVGLKVIFGVLNDDIHLSACHIDQLDLIVKMYRSVKLDVRI